VVFKLDTIPSHVHSLWFIINAFSGDSLKDVDKAIFNIYNDDDDDDAASDILYSYDVGMGFDSGAILLGILYRASSNKERGWEWTIVEEKNLYSNLIKNNLKLIYDEKILNERPNDRNIKYELTKCNERYIIDPNISKLTIGLGFDHRAINDESDDDIKADKFDIDFDVDVDGSILVFSKIEMEENEKGVEEETCQQIDIVNNNNGFYKTYVQYVKDENYAAPISPKKNKKDNNEDSDDSELLADNSIEDDESFDIYISKMNSDNDIGSLCVLLNIFNDNNQQNKDKTNNLSRVCLKLYDENKKELCCYFLESVNKDNKTCALVLCYLSKLTNGCWTMITNDIALKNNSKLDYQQYAKLVVLGKYTQNCANKDSCCAIL